MLVVKNIDVYYGKINAVRRASLHVSEGEIVALIGGNGAGKTTMLNTISGLIRAFGGSILYDGQDITKQPPDRIVQMGYRMFPRGGSSSNL